MTKTTPAIDGKLTESSPTRTLTVECEETGSSEAISFDELEVLVPAPDSNKREKGPTVYEQSNGTKVLVEVGEKVLEWTWLFFESGCLVYLVKMDDLPKEYASRKHCLRSWPHRILLKPHRAVGGELDMVTFSDGLRLHPRWDLTVLEFDPALRGTSRFFEPLEEDRVSFTLDEVRNIRAIGSRGMAEEDAKALHRTNAPCLVCKWHHAPGQFTSFASGSTHFTLSPNSTAHKALKLVHDFMEKHDGAAMPRKVWNANDICDEPAAIFRRHKNAWGMIGVPMHHVQILPPDQYRIDKRTPPPARKSVPKSALLKRKLRHN